MDLIKKNINDYEISNNILNNEISVLFNNLKNIVAQNKAKIKNINTNINDIYINLNLINSNIEKKKYQLASSRVEKLLQIKNMILINIKQLDNNQQKFLDELKYEQFSKKLNHSSSTIKVKPAPTPFPTTSFFTINNNNKESNIVKRKLNAINNSNQNLKDFISAKKKINNRRNRDFSFSLKGHIRSTSNNNTLKEYSTITNFYKKNKNTNKEIGLIDNKKEIDELKRKLISQKAINDKLRREIERLKVNVNKSNKINNNSNEDIYNNNNLKQLSINMSDKICLFNDKINKTSDLLFSLTFSFNSLQNKCNKISNKNETEQDFLEIKNKLLNITTEISELKSYLLKITFQIEEYKKNIDNNQMSIFSNNAIYQI